jgi:hypothetical protein
MPYNMSIVYEMGCNILQPLLANAAIPNFVLIFMSYLFTGQSI